MTTTIKYVNNFFGKCKHFKVLKPTIILILSLPIVHYKQGGKKKWRWVCINSICLNTLAKLMKTYFASKVVMFEECLAY
jgi:hypothetical protein